MYQGKFANKSGGKKQPSSPERVRVPDNTAVNQAEQAYEPYRSASQMEQSADNVRIPEQRPRETMAAPQIPNPQGRPMPPRVPRQPNGERPGLAPERSPYPGERQENPNFTQPGVRNPGDRKPIKKVKKRWKGRLIGGLVFYLLLAIAVAGAYLLIEKNQQPLVSQLQTYEQKQPGYVSQQVFSSIFENPDWGAIYDNAGVQPTVFESKDAFTRFMTEKTSGKALRYQGESRSQDGEITYNVYLEDEKIASFRMINESADSAAPVWKLDGISVYFQGDGSYRIRSAAGHVVKINGVALDDSYLIEKSGKRLTEDLGDLSAKAKLPGIRIYEVKDLLVEPVITIEDSAGNQQPVLYNAEDALFFEDTEAVESVPEDAKELALNAVTTYCEYMIKKTNMATLGRYFNTDTSTYQAIVSSDLTWIQSEKGHATANEKVYDYVKLGEDAFSVRVSLTWQLTRKDDSIKESPVDVTLVFERDGSGNLRCQRMTGVEFVDSFRSVRFRFRQHDQVLQDVMVDSNAKAVTCPIPEIPEGKKLAGWVVLQKDENGKEFYQRVLAPDDQGNAVISAGLLDGPQTLYPVFAK